MVAEKFHWTRSLMNLIKGVFNFLSNLIVLILIKLEDFQEWIDWRLSPSLNLDWVPNHNKPSAIQNTSNRCLWHKKNPDPSLISWFLTQSSHNPRHFHHCNLLLWVIHTAILLDPLPMVPCSSILSEFHLLLSFDRGLIICRVYKDSLTSSL